MVSLVSGDERNSLPSRSNILVRGVWATLLNVLHRVKVLYQVRPRSVSSSNTIDARAPTTASGRDKYQRNLRNWKHARDTKRRACWLPSRGGVLTQSAVLALNRDA